MPDPEKVVSVKPRTDTELLREILAEIRTLREMAERIGGRGPIAAILGMKRNG